MTLSARLRVLQLTSLAAASAVAVLGLDGCQLGTMQLSGANVSGPVAAAKFGGSVYGGQSPVFGSSIQVYAAGMPAQPTTGTATGGFGQGAVALLTPGSMTPGSINNYWPNGSAQSGATCIYTGSNTNKCTSLPQTDAGGNWAVTAPGFACPSASTPIYIVAAGGDPTGQATLPANNNPYLALMTSLGACGSLANGSTVQLNEVTTVAAVYALSQFLAPPSGVPASMYAKQGALTSATAGIPVNLGASSGPVGGYGPSAVQTQQVGLMNAARMVDNLTDYTQGTATPRAANSWATPYSAKLYTLANILASCINTVPSSTSTGCTSLFSATTNGLTTSYNPQDTIQAAWMMARNPNPNVAAGTNYVSTLFNLSTATPPFNGLSAAPNDLSVEVGMSPLLPASTGAVESPAVGAVDEYGHVWLANLNNGSAFVSEIDANGGYLAGPYTTYTATGGYAAPTGSTYAPDPCAPGSTHVIKYASSGPKGMAIDYNNNVYIANTEEVAPANCDATTNRTIMVVAGSQANGSGSAISSGVYYSGTPYATAVDGNNTLWVGASNGTLASYYGSSALTTFGVTTATVGSGTQGVTVDNLGNGGNVWMQAGKTCGGTGGVLYQIPVSSYATPSITAGYYPAATTSCTTNGGGTVGISTSGFISNTTTGLAADANGGIWQTNESAQTQMTYYLPFAPGWSTTSGSTISSPAVAGSTPTSFGGLANPYWVAVDGSSNAWVANNSGQTLVELKAAVSGGSLQFTSVAGTTGLQTPSSVTGVAPKSAKGVMVDPSGNVWILNASSTAVNYVTVVVGAATPVITPLQFQAKYQRVGMTPQ